MVSLMLPESMSTLALSVGCSKYPQRWDDLYPTLRQEFMAHGTPYTDPDYYTDLHNKYGILTEVLPLYQKAAVAVREDPELSLFLHILCRTLEDQNFHKSDMAAFSRPKQKDSLGCDMLCGLAAASEAPMCHKALTERGLPENIVKQVLRMPEFGVKFYQMRHNGAPGYNLLDWFQLAIDGHLFRLGRLEFEIFTEFRGRCCVFENDTGEQIALAHDIHLHHSGNALGSAGYEDTGGAFTAMIREDPDHYSGHPVREDGTVEQRSIVLPKETWRKRLSFGDPVVSLHIPAGGGLTDEAVTQSLEEGKAFLQQYFPDYSYKGFVCYSWLMDPQLENLVGADSNIAKFNRRFRKMTRKSQGDGVFSFIFLQSGNDFDLSMLPETTTLERKLKEHYLSGKYIYELTGYFF